MAIFKSQAQVLTASGQELGEGLAYLHLPRGLERAQQSGGTISLRSWRPSGEPPTALCLEDGRRLEVRVSRDALSECSRNRVLRFQFDWPG